MKNDGEHKWEDEIKYIGKKRSGSTFIVAVIAEVESQDLWKMGSTRIEMEKKRLLGFMWVRQGEEEARVQGGRREMKEEWWNGFSIENGGLEMEERGFRLRTVNDWERRKENDWVSNWEWRKGFHVKSKGGKGKVEWVSRLSFHWEREWKVKFFL